MESAPRQSFKSVSGFELDTFCLVADSLTARHADAQTYIEEVRVLPAEIFLSFFVTPSL